MTIKPPYKTRQRELLLSYLETVPGRHVTTNDILAYLHDQGHSIGTATVYRQLERLVDEGLVNKYILDAQSPACFEYIGQSQCSVEESCFHCKCEKCGCLIHLHCDELKGIARHLERDHHFRLDPLRTVFYGLCENCQKGDEPNA